MKRPLEVRSLAVRFALVVAGACLMALAAKLAVRVGSADITAQTLALPLLVASLGTAASGFALVLYLAAGALGLPVFAAGVAPGPGPLTGPAAGFLWAYPVAAWLTGWMYDSGLRVNYGGRVVAVLLGTAVVLATGTSWLSYSTGGLARAYALGVAPYLVADVVKVLIGAGPPSLWPRIAAALRVT